jgi:hypothetical protein
MTVATRNRPFVSRADTALRILRSGAFTLAMGAHSARVRRRRDKRFIPPPPPARLH